MLVVILAVSMSSAPGSASMARELGATLATATTSVAVDAPERASGCTFVRLTPTPASRRLVTARGRLRAADHAPEAFTIDVVGQGFDARGVECRRTAAARVTLAGRAAALAPGTPTTLRIIGDGFVIDAAGVVVPCRASERRDTPDAVCARTATGRVVLGCAEPDGAVIHLTNECNR